MWNHGPIRAPVGPRTRKTADRRGLAATEVAVTLPLLVLLVFGSIEMANVTFLKQSLRIAAYEGARAAGRAGGTTERGIARVEQILEDRRVSDFEVTISPRVTEFTPRGTMLTVTVTAPAATYSVGPMWFFNDRTVVGQYRLVRL
ncbi:MAG: TadE/TadG family type IV pilus assembly protein [Patescibacteria group bacterium]|nr:TadE/TadG family type IV pilus assembly protein [Patescibacteria group bacterium]